MGKEVDDDNNNKDSQKLFKSSGSMSDLGNSCINMMPDGKMPDGKVQAGKEKDGAHLGQDTSWRWNLQLF